MHDHERRHVVGFLIDDLYRFLDRRGWLEGNKLRFLFAPRGAAGWLSDDEQVQTLMEATTLQRQSRVWAIVAGVLLSLKIMVLGSSFATMPMDVVMRSLRDTPIFVGLLLLFALLTRTYWGTTRHILWIERARVSTAASED